MRCYGCCEHCDHEEYPAGVSHDIPCPQGCKGVRQ